MPSGNYPEFKDKAKTKPHPAAGLSKNAYKSDGTKRERKSRAKLGDAATAIGITGDLTKGLNKRITFFKQLQKDLMEASTDGDTSLEFEDASIDLDMVNHFLELPALMATKEAGEIYDAFNEEGVEYDAYNPNYRGKGWELERQRKSGAEYTKGERQKFALKEGEIASETPLLMRDVLRKKYEKEHRAKKGATFVSPDMTIEPRFGKINQQKQDTEEHLSAKKFLEENLLTSRGLTRKRAKRWDAGMSKEQRDRYVADKAKAKESGDVAEKPHVGVPPVVPVRRDKVMLNETVSLDDILFGDSDDEFGGEKGLMDKPLQYDGPSLSLTDIVANVVHNAPLMVEAPKDTGYIDADQDWRKRLISTSDLVGLSDDEEESGSDMEVIPWEYKGIEYYLNEETGEFFDRDEQELQGILSKDGKTVQFTNEDKDVEDMDSFNLAVSVDSDSDSDMEVEEWEFDGISYLLDTKKGDVYDYDEQELVGKKGEGKFAEKQKPVAIISPVSTKPTLPKASTAEVPAVRWDEGYLQGYSFSAKASKFDTFENAMGAYEALNETDRKKVAGITHSKERGKDVFSLRKGQGRALKPSDIDKSYILDPKKML